MDGDDLGKGSNRNGLKKGYPNDESASNDFAGTPTNSNKSSSGTNSYAGIKAAGRSKESPSNNSSNNNNHNNNNNNSNSNNNNNSALINSVGNASSGSGHSPATSLSSASLKKMPMSTIASSATDLNRRLYFCEKRHHSVGKRSLFHPVNLYPIHPWRMKERLKTVSVGLIVCLNIGVDPPDILKTNPCARLECWIDPSSLQPQKALESIMKNLQQQYEFWQPRARYKTSMDPTVEDVKKLCSSLRRSAKDERVLLHYNGHGVPKPTKSGEIWVFNKEFTQYIPLSIFDVHQWIGNPAILVYDCSGAGHLIDAYESYMERRLSGSQLPLGGSGSASEPQKTNTNAANALHNATSDQALESSSRNNSDTNLRDSATPLSKNLSSSMNSINNPSFDGCIQLAACRFDEILPMNPNLPADLFTACLTTPIEIAIRWSIMSNSPLKLVPLNVAVKIPGRLNDRRTPLGELNWIFTAITDTIAWTSFPRDLFRRLFRQDLLVAGLYRNFLLAERIMTAYNCHPQSYPSLPDTSKHPLWDAWDMALDFCLSQLPSVLDHQQEYQYSTFFTEQLTSFEKWLERAGTSCYPPEQLTIVLQVLLSQAHRVKALVLICRFLELGPWAVSEALAVGIFPYILKLLQSPAAELNHVLLSIWSRILAVDSTCQADLLKDNGYQYFTNTLFSRSHGSNLKLLATFVLSVFVYKYSMGQNVFLRCSSSSYIVDQGQASTVGSSNNPVFSTTSPFAYSSIGGNRSAPASPVNIVEVVLSFLKVGGNSNLRKWACMLLANTVDGNVDAKLLLLNTYACLNKLQPLVADPDPEVRACVIYFISQLLGDTSQSDATINQEQSMVVMLLSFMGDASPMVRRELVIALSNFVYLYQNKFLVTAYELWEEERTRMARSSLNKSRGLYRTASEQQHKSSGTGNERPTSSPDQRNPFTQSSSSSSSNKISHHISIYSCTWRAILGLGADPHPTVSELAWHIIDEVHRLIIPKPTASSNPVISSSISQRGSETNISSGTFGTITGGDSEVGPSSPFRRVFSMTSMKPGSSPVASSRESIHSVIITDNYNSHEESDKKSITSSINNKESEFIPVTKLPLESDLHHYMLESFAQTVVAEDSAWSNPSALENPELDGHIVKIQAKMPKFYVSETNLVAPLDLYPENYPPGRKIDDQIRVIGSTHNVPIKSLCFGSETGSLDHELVVSGNNRGIISVYNWREGNAISIFDSNRANQSRAVLSLQILSSKTYAPLLLAGSCDGSIRVWRGWNDSYFSSVSLSPMLVSSWKALPELVSFNRRQSSGFHTALSVSKGQVIVGGDCRAIRIWDLERELCVQDLEGAVGMTCISLDSCIEHSGLFMSGYADGSVRLFDRRAPSSQSNIQTFLEDKQAIMAIKYDKESRLFQSVNRFGLVKYWDIGMPHSVKTLDLSSAGNVSNTGAATNSVGAFAEASLAVSFHPKAPLVATGISKSSPSVRVYSIPDPINLICNFRYFEGFLGQRISPVSQLAYHPDKLLLAVGSDDGTISLLGERLSV